MITVGELFAGIGGFSLAFHAAGAQTAWFVEKEPYCQQVLSKHWPGVPIYGDIYDCHELPYVDVLTAGFPCQPFSLAGKRQGVNDERYLVPEMFRVIEEVQPHVVLFENVPGFTNIAAGHTFREFLRALAESGYDAQWGHFRASDAGAPHQRERWLCVAYADTRGWRNGGANRGGRNTTRIVWIDEVDKKRNGNQSSVSMVNGQSGRLSPGRQRTRKLGGTSRYNIPALEESSALGNANPAGRREYCRAVPIQSPFATAQRASSQRAGATTQPRLGRVADGLSGWLDEPRWPARPGQPQHAWEPPRVVAAQRNRTQRLKALGNAVVPQVIYPVACEIVAYLQAQLGEEVA